MKTKMSIPQRILAYVKGNPIIVMISISDIVPPPIGTAVISKLASNEIPSTCNII